MHTIWLRMMVNLAEGLFEEIQSPVVQLIPTEYMTEAHHSPPLLLNRHAQCSTELFGKMFTRLRIDDQGSLIQFGSATSLFAQKQNALLVMPARHVFLSDQVQSVPERIDSHNIGGLIPGGKLLLVEVRFDVHDRFPSIGCEPGVNLRDLIFDLFFIFVETSLFPLWLLRDLHEVTTSVHIRFAQKKCLQAFQFFKHALCIVESIDAENYLIGEPVFHCQSLRHRSGCS